MKNYILTLGNILFITCVITVTSCSRTSSQAVPNSEETINIPALNNYDKFAGGAQITFNEYDFDFGIVSKENKLHHTFYFVNSGDTPLIISDAKGSCGCTIPFFPKDPINPGEQEKIDITIDPSGKKEGQVFKVAVRIESNADNKFVKLNLSGTPELKTETTSN
ncbi:MAG: hypothetical protein ACJA0Q_000343 [Saprospiraceae bacterium]|jgi:hypothetical protein